MALYFPTTRPKEEESTSLINRLLVDGVLQEFQEKELSSFIQLHGFAWLFRLSDCKINATRYLKERIQSIPELKPYDARIAFPLELQPGRIKLIDNRYVVRISERAYDAEKYRWVGATKLRDLPLLDKPGKRALLIEFPTDSVHWPREQLATIERWRAEGWLDFGEPDLIVQITEDQAATTNDMEFPQQEESFTLQGVQEAWLALAALNAEHQYGNPEVYVATVDTGIQKHRDLRDVDSDAEFGPRIARCFDFLSLQDCESANYSPHGNHGLGTLGIIAARPDNGHGIAGIAPNTHQIVLKRPFSVLRYAEALAWAAGLDTDNKEKGWPTETANPPAAIICCPNGVYSENGISQTMDEMLTKIAKEGRGGKGSLVIFAAGNDGRKRMKRCRPWPAHKDAMAVANSAPPDSNGVEKLHSTSNVGQELDLCAQGEGSRSLGLDDSTQNFGGTSAAAAWVAAAAALVLSVNPEWDAEKVRSILVNTAEKIDPGATGFAQWDTQVDGREFSKFYGYGRLNIGAAVKEAIASLG